MSVVTEPATTLSASGRGESLRVLEQEVGVLIKRVRRVIGERARAVHPDLQAGSYLMLGHVAEHGPMRASGLCTVFGVDKGAVSRQVQHLLDLGLLDRTPDPEDGRATLLSVSADGERRLGTMTVERRQWFDERLVGWTDGELTSLADGLRRYNEALEV